MNGVLVGTVEATLLILLVTVLLGPIVADGSAWRTALWAVPATLGALAGIAGIGGAALSADRPVESAGVYLVGIAALTVPHVVVVAWMDARQRVWTAAREGTQEAGARARGDLRHPL